MRSGRAGASRALHRTSWEIDTARLYALWSLFYLGEIRELTERVPRLQREANERGDRYGEAGLSTGLAVVAALAPGNKPIEDIQARTHEVLVRWSRAGYHVQHLWRLIANVLCRLYVGDGRRAWHAIDSSWKQLERSTLLRLQYARVEARYLRAIAALGAASESTDRARLLHAASRCAHQLGREGVPWATALGLLVRGCSAAQCGEDQAAESLLGDAAAACERASMGLFASVARRRRGEVTAGTRGAALVAEADRWMVAQGIQSPANVAAMLAPVRRV